MNTYARLSTALIALACFVAMPGHSIYSIPAVAAPVQQDAQQAESIPALVYQPPFEIKSVTERLLYTADALEQINANGKVYLAFDGEPTRVPAVELEIVGNAVPYVEITKVGSTDFPDVVDEYKPGQFVYEHKGAGIYHVRSLNQDNRPVYSQFEVEGATQPPDDGPGDDPTNPPDDDPPTGDHGELADLVRELAPADPETARAIAAAYGSAINETTEAMSLADVRKLVQQKREEAFIALPPLRFDWNAYLLASGKYLAGLESKADYLAAIKVAADELQKVKTAAEPATPAQVTLQAAPVVQSPEIIIEPVPIRQPLLRRVWIPAGCDGFGNCWPGHWDYR